MTWPAHVARVRTRGVRLGSRELRSASAASPRARPVSERMHGVKRLTAEKRLAKRKENEERAAAYRARSGLAFERRAAGLHDQESLDAISKVVLENTDLATLWNFRRQVLRGMHPDGDSDARKAACKAEFTLTQECLQMNPKSYPVWYHRQWVVEWGECSWQWPVRPRRLRTQTPEPVVFFLRVSANESTRCACARPSQVELKLTAKFLALDDRNFHCWTYRRFVVHVAGVSAEAELTFTTSKIEANFSNYSAWHYRSKLLGKMHGSSAGGGESLAARVRSDLELVRNAFFTAPEDSSAWFYHRWLLGQLAPGGAASAPREEYEGVLAEEAAMIDELLELEPECKWALASAVFLRAQQQQLGAGGAAGIDEARIEMLKRIDPMRTRYYTAQASAGDAAPVSVQ